MVDEPLLAPDTYDVLSRIPAEWWDEDNAVLTIAEVTNQRVTATCKRLAHLIGLGLVERRKRQQITPSTEIRKVGK